MSGSLASIRVRDGLCPAWVYTPGMDGAWPAVLMFMDAPGMRPALQEIAERLAESGYYVLLPDLYYRSGPYEPIHAAEVFTDKVARAAHRERFTSLAPAEAVVADTQAFLDFIDDDPRAHPGPYGGIGYCMGGRLALLAAGTYPNRIAVAVSYHGGNLATDAPLSPHRLADRIKAEIYVAGATNDANFDDAHKERLEEALTAAGVCHRIETYPARHGWVPRDTAAHDPAEAEHHWRTLLPLLDRVLKS